MEKQKETTTKKTPTAAAAASSSKGGGGGGGNSRKRGAAPEALQRMAFLLKAASLAAEQANSGMRLGIVFSRK